MDRMKLTPYHTPSIAFWHLPPNSARIETLPEFGYATAETLFISTQLSTNAVSALERFGC